MKRQDGPPVGLMIGSAIPPEKIAPLSRLGEELGYSELWIPEDYFFTGGVSGVAVALGATERIKVGFSIVSAVVRHPAVLAMELATLSRAYPGRVLPGVGLGVPFWLGQMGLKPRSSLAAVRECITSVRTLLDGEELTSAEGMFEFDQVKLTHPATEPLPIYAGLMGPKMLNLAGQVADGLIIGATSSTKYVTWARERVAEGAAAVGRNVDHFRYPCLVIACIDRDAKAAKAVCRPLVAFYLSIVGASAYSDTYGITDELNDMLARGGQETVEREMPDQWVEDLALAGDPEECAEKVRVWLAAGADSVVLFPMPVERGEEMLRLAAAEMLPRLR